ncbi:MAG TPA: histidine phosphatase family protein [Streptosporangiaceae bacterium]|jgi:broad specificity phosphatase PhoE
MTDPGPPAATTIVHLLRHGEVENPRGVLYGRLPGFHLSEDGAMMAKAAADFLAARDVTVLRSSPLERAAETAEPLAAQTGLRAETDERLIEPSNHFEGQHFGPGDGSLLRPGHWYYLRNPFRPSWGEPYREVLARMRAAVHDVAGQAAGHEAVCVSHQLPIWIMRRSAEGRPLWHDPRRRQCALGSITSFTYRSGRLVGVSYFEPSDHRPRQVAGA